MICFYESNGISWRKQKTNLFTHEGREERHGVPLFPQQIFQVEKKRQPTNMSKSSTTFALAYSLRQLKKWTISKNVHTCLEQSKVLFGPWWRNNCCSDIKIPFDIKESDRLDKKSRIERAFFEVGFTHKKSCLWNTLNAVRLGQRV